MKYFSEHEQQNLQSKNFHGLLYAFSNVIERTSAPSLELFKQLFYRFMNELFMA